MIERRDRLRKILIPKKQSISGIYRISTKEKAFGYSLLMHAEIESYIEDRIGEVADVAFNLWKGDARTTRPLISMIAYREGNETGFSDDLFAIRPEKKLDSVVHNCKAQMDSRIKSNNGVRLKSITRLFMSIGLVLPASEEVLMAALDGFGSKRGEYAHKSPGHELLVQHDPITEADEIDGLIAHLSSLDKIFDEYKLAHLL